VPGTYFRSGGSGLGFALGGALGAKLAGPARRVVSLVGDGAFLFGAPIAALWAMHLARTPVLTVVLANGGYAASRAPVFQLFPEGDSARQGDVLGTLFEGGPDYAGLARACGAWGARVERAADLVPVLGQGLSRVDAGQSAVVVVPVASRWISSDHQYAKVT
jgi:acetolactate synthase-1/2/3 large subunit